METTTLTKNTEVPVPWYWVKVNGSLVGWVVNSSGSGWRAILNGTAAEYGHGGLFGTVVVTPEVETRDLGTFTSRKLAVAEIEYWLKEGGR